jgi:hypothetical protein
LVFSATKEVRPTATEPDEPAESGSEKKAKKFTPVSFRSGCIVRLQKFLKDTLVKQTSAIYSTPNGKIAVLSATSREYEMSDGTGYWFGFHPAQKETLETYEDAWVTFGCGSEKQILAFPLAKFVEWLPRFNRTELEDRFYWHVQIEKRQGKWIVNAKRGNEKIDATSYALPS